jgi:hypothetical protein
MLRIRSVDDPFRNPGLLQRAITTLARAEAMGLLPQELLIESLDADTLWSALDHIAHAGIGLGLHRTIAEPSPANTPGFERLLDEVNEALEESPAPAFEWPRLAAALGIELLGRLLAISPSSIRRYKDRARITPDVVAARLHFLALVVGDLAGTYNEIGIRRWFDRSRAPLDHQSPADVLRDEWTPRQPGPQKVRALARSLVSAPAT